MARALSYRDLYDLYLDTLLECVRSATAPEAGSTDTRGWLEREVEREYTQVRDAALSDPIQTFHERPVRERRQRPQTSLPGLAAIASPVK